ncbi:hypothetical protein F5051DRAFT_489561, partial [Lentinula edodes]
WCQENSLIVSASKSRVMLFGVLPHTLPQFTLCGKPLKFRDIVRYVGIFFPSTHRNIFASHYTKKHDCTVGTTHAITGCDLLIGNHHMPPAISKQLYTTLVDCHLTNGCRIIPDTNPSMPICMCRISLILRYLKYLMGLPSSHYASLALKESNNLCNSHSPCWLSDLDYAISQLPGNHCLPNLRSLNRDHIDRLIKSIEFSTKADLQSHINTWSKLSLLQHCLEPNKEGPPKPQLIGLQHDLMHVTNHSHRCVITKLLCGDYI